MYIVILIMCFVFSCVLVFCVNRILSLKHKLNLSLSDSNYQQKRTDILKDDLEFYQTSLNTLQHECNKLSHIVFKQTEKNDKLKSELVELQTEQKQFIDIAGTIFNIDEIQHVELNSVKKDLVTGQNEDCLKIWFKSRDSSCFYHFFTGEHKEQATKDVQQLLKIERI